MTSKIVDLCPNYILGANRSDANFNRTREVKPRAIDYKKSRSLAEEERRYNAKNNTNSTIIETTAADGIEFIPIHKYNPADNIHSTPALKTNKSDNILVHPIHEQNPADNILSTPIPDQKLPEVCGIPILEPGRTDIYNIKRRTEPAEKKEFAINAGSESVEIKWTNHGYKHFPQKNMPWKDIVKSTKIGDAKYRSGINIEQFEKMAWENGVPVNNGKTWRVFKSDEIIGAKNGIETSYVRIEMSTGTMHGHPITPADYKKLIG